MVIVVPIIAVVVELLSSRERLDINTNMFDRFAAALFGELEREIVVLEVAFLDMRDMWARGRSPGDEGSEDNVGEVHVAFVCLFLSGRMFLFWFVVCDERLFHLRSYYCIATYYHESTGHAACHTSFVINKEACVWWAK
jgi:hypothetical protein